MNIVESCADSDVNFIRQNLIKFNERKMGRPAVVEPIRYTLKDATDSIVGGIVGLMYMECLTIDSSYATFHWIPIEGVNRLCFIKSLEPRRD